MTKSKLAAWIIATVVLVGGGAALAETATEGPSIVEADDGDSSATDGDGTDGDDTTADGDGTDGDGTDGEGDSTETDGEDDGTEDESKAHPDNHGALVSAAAHDHQYDEACGNHGKVVSSVARTGELPECATAAPGDDAGGDDASATASNGHKKSDGKASKSGGKPSKSGKSGGKSAGKGGGKKR